MKIAVGTTNPVKLQAVHAVFALLFPDKTCEVLGVKVSSGVNDQPMSDTESVKGARTRAKAAFQAIKGADFGVGLEGGLEQVENLWFTGNIACVVSNSKTGYGMSPKVLIPQELMDEISNGHDLSEAMHTVTGIADIGKKQGLLGYVTMGHITRQSASEQAIVAALASILND